MNRSDLAPFSNPSECYGEKAYERVKSKGDGCCYFVGTYKAFHRETFEGFDKLVAHRGPGTEGHRSF